MQIKHIISKLVRSPYLPVVMVVAIVSVVGVALLLVSRAAVSFVSVQPESGTISAPASRVNDTMASGGAAIKFGAGTVTPPPGGATEANLKVAFVGDTTISTQTRSALSLVKSEGAQLLVHVGDFDYTNNPTAWDTQANAIIGSNFPQFGILGNHEDNINGYIASIDARQKRSPGLTCTGQPGVMQDCTFKGLRIIGTAPGLTGVVSTGHDTYLRDRIAASPNIWNVCAHHKNQTAMQAGSKRDEAGWGVYEECRKGGGFDIAGHEHSYSRTKTLTNMMTQTVDPTCNSQTNVCVAKGKTFAIVNGLGGKGAIDGQTRCLPTTGEYGCNKEWAKFYTSSQGATFAMLFITFNVDGNPNKARGYLKNISGQIVDNFDIVRQ